MLLKNHLDIIGRNEPIQRKAKFWQSYVRALKGTDDMRAPDRVSTRPRSIFRPLLSDFPELASSWPYNKSIYDEPLHAVDRIATPGYRYMPVSREIYGYSPRNLYPAPYKPAIHLMNCSYGMAAPLPLYDAQKAWDDHLKRLADIDRLYPSKYPLSARHASPFKDVPKDLSYNYAGVPIFNRGGYTRRPLKELLEPSIHLPISRLTHDPWWWAYPSLRPYSLPYGWNKTPFYLRDSYLSPVKRTYLWGQHPIRPFGFDARREILAALNRLHNSTALADLEDKMAAPLSGTPAFAIPEIPARKRRSASPSDPYLDEYLRPHSELSRVPWWWDFPTYKPDVFRYKDIPTFLRDFYLAPVEHTYSWYELPRPFVATYDLRRLIERNLWRLEHTEDLEILEDELFAPRERPELPVVDIEGVHVYDPEIRKALQPLNSHSRLAREPWWWEYEELRPNVADFKDLPSFLRNSYLSPIKSSMHWYEHPGRPITRKTHNVGCSRKFRNDRVDRALSLREEVGTIKAPKK